MRLLTNDERAQAALVEAWLATNATLQSPAYRDQVVLCGWGARAQLFVFATHVHEAFAALLEHDVLSVESPALVRQALQWFAACPADFPDCPLAARARNVGCETLLTLDRKAAKTATHRLLK